METGIKVLDAMTQNPIVVSQDTNLKECANIMAENHVGALLIKEGEDVIGIVTEQDIVRKSVLNDHLPSKAKVGSIMEEGLVRVSSSDDIRDAIRKMGDHNVRHLPVFEKNNFVGLLTTKDILKIEPQLFEILASKIELKEEERKPINNIHENEGICELCGNYTTVLNEHEGSMICSICKE